MVHLITYTDQHNMTGQTLNTSFKGNLSYNVIDLYFLCLSFHLEIYNMLKTKNIENKG